MLKSVFAFLVAPFPAALFQSLVVAKWPKPEMGIFENSASMFVAICIYAYAFGSLLGIPAAIWLRRRGKRTLSAYAVAGLGVWLLPIMTGLGFGFAQGQLSLYIAIYNLALFGAGGLAAGVLVWWISQPDQLNQVANQL